MPRFCRKLVPSLLMLTFCLGSLTLFQACTQAQLQKAQTVSLNIAKGASTAAGATTQPLVLTIEALAPQTTPFIQLFGLVATGLAGAATTAAGIFGKQAATSSTTAQTMTAVANTAATALTSAHASVAEIFGDILAYKDPATPWTTTTEKLLKDLGLNSPPPGGNTAG